MPTTTTPINITSKIPSFRSGRHEIISATSKDGVWTYERAEEPGTPWIITHVPTGHQEYLASLPKARKWTADRRTLHYIEQARRRNAIIDA